MANLVTSSDPFALNEELSVEELAGSGNQLAAHFLQRVQTASDQGPKGYPDLDTLRSQFMHALEECKEREDWDWEAAIRLVWAVQDYLDVRGHWKDWITALGIGITAARKLRHRYDESAFLGNLGTAHRKRGQIGLAIKYHEQAFALAHEIGSRQGEGTHLGNLGSAYHALGEMERAIECHEQALIISREVRDERSEGNHLSNLGSVYRDLGLTNRNQDHMERAIKYYKQALVIARKIGDRRGEGARLGKLGSIYTDLIWIERPTELPLEQVTQAIEYLEQSVAINQEIGDRHGESRNLASMGTALRVLGEVKLAIEKYEDALDIAHELKDQEGEGSILASLGNAYHALGKVERAQAYLEQALAIFEKVNSPYADQARKDLNHTLDNDPN